MVNGQPEWATRANAKRFPNLKRARRVKGLLATRGIKVLIEKCEEDDGSLGILGKKRKDVGGRNRRGPSGV